MATIPTTTRKRTAPRKRTVRKETIRTPILKTPRAATKADLEKRLENLQKEIVNTVKDYAEDGTLCATEQKNIQQRFKKLGVDFPVPMAPAALHYRVTISCDDMPYLQQDWGMELDNDNEVQQEIEKAILSMPLPVGCSVDIVDLDDYEF